MSRVFQNIDPPPLRMASVYPPWAYCYGYPYAVGSGVRVAVGISPWGEDTLTGRRGGGLRVNILEDARHRIALLQ
jgi:hypothetical protein